MHTTGALPSEDRKSEERAALMPFSEYAALKRRNGDRATLAALPGAVAGLMGCSAVIASVYSDVFTAPPEAPELLWCVLLPQCALQPSCRCPPQRRCRGMDPIVSGALASTGAGVVSFFVSHFVYGVAWRAANRDTAQAMAAVQTAPTRPPPAPRR